MVEGEVMDGIAAIEQSSIYVEQVSVGCMPEEARANEGAGRGYRMRRVNQSCHLRLDSGLREWVIGQAAHGDEREPVVRIKDDLLSLQSSLVRYRVLKM